jgi:hypothetical protein
MPVETDVPGTGTSLKETDPENPEYVKWLTVVEGEEQPRAKEKTP